MSAAGKHRGALLLIFLGWLTGGPAAADVFTWSMEPPRDLGARHGASTVAVRCRVTLQTSGTPVPSYYHAESRDSAITQIYPQDFCLNCEQNRTNTQSVSAVFTVPRPNGNYFTSLDIRNLDGLQPSSTCDWRVASIGDLDISDRVELYGDPKYLNPSAFSPLTGGPVLPVPKSFYPIHYAARFIDEPPASPVVSWSWSIQLQYVGGAYELVVVSPPGTGNSSEYIIGKSFSLPDKPWLRDDDGNVLAIVRVGARTSSLFEYWTVRFVGVKIPPNRPSLAMTMRCPSKVELTFSAPGATAYQAHYGPGPQPPLLGTDAKEGPSPVAAGAGPGFLLTDLGAGPHSFAATATGPHGVSPLSEILDLPFDLNVAGPVLLASGQRSVHQAANLLVVPSSETYRIPAGAAATFRAGKSITLRPGFTAGQGSEVSLTIAACK